MQNRYCGDIGDFSKLGLLRALLTCDIPIGINWYLVPDETHNSDGRHVKYLEQDSFRKCDEELWKELGQIVHEGKRSVRSLQSESMLPAVHYSDLLNLRGKQKHERAEIRRKWHGKALDRLAKAGIICADPDNGLIVPSAEGSVRESKYILPREITDYYRQGSSVIYYQHKARKLDPYYIEQHRRLLKEPELGGASGIILKFKTTSQRYYCFIIQPDHEALVRGAIKEMLSTAWGDHFVLI